MGTEDVEAKDEKEEGGVARRMAEDYKTKRNEGQEEEERGQEETDYGAEERRKR